MPELPEVEALRLGLISKIVGSKIIGIEIIKPKIISGKGTTRKESKGKTERFLEKVKARKIKEIRRIAKNLIIELDNKSVLVIHLKMTGQLVFVGKNKEKTFGGHPIIKSYTDDLPNKHTAIIFNLNNGKLFYNDVRMFGYVLFYSNLLEAKEQGHFKDIGLDPFDEEFTLNYFKNELKKKNKSIKAVLLEQSVVNGCGNIYADEICFASKVLPIRICKSLNDKEISILYKNIKKILSLAIKHGGSSVSNYLLSDGSRGNYAKLHKVYKRAGGKCKVCESVLEKSIVAGRTTVFCKACQK